MLGILPALYCTVLTTVLHVVVLRTVYCPESPTVLRVPRVRTVADRGAQFHCSVRSVLCVCSVRSVLCVRSVCSVRQPILTVLTVYTNGRYTVSTQLTRRKNQDFHYVNDLVKNDSTK